MATDTDPPLPLDGGPVDTLCAVRGSPLRGSTPVPGDKSISHRAVILGGMASGESRVYGLLQGEDVLGTVAALKAMGVAIESGADGALVIHGRGVDGLQEPDQVLDLGNSGTSLRLLAGVVASMPMFAVLTGDESLRRRPMGRVVQPLTRMGARIQGRDNGRKAPLAIQGGTLVPISYASPVASAQVKSAILLAGINTAGVTSVTEPVPTRDHTERMLAYFGARVTREGNTASLEGWPDLTGRTLRVPGDFSSAVFPLAAALLVPGSAVTITGVGVNPTRTGWLDLVAAMGGRVERRPSTTVAAGEEPVADLHVVHTPLRGIEIGGEVVSRAIDEFPMVFIMAALAEGETVIRDAAELRVKESDRIAVMARGLRQLGVTVEELPSGARIRGCPEGLAGGVEVDAAGDHRAAMSFLVAGLCSRRPVTVRSTRNIATSFPGFVGLMRGLGADLASVDEGWEER